MGEYVIRLPDIGEGIAEAELVEWLVSEGQVVQEDQALAAVMTDKATVEIPSPVDGRILWLGPAIGDTVAIGLPIIRLEVAGAGNVAPGEDVTPPPAGAAAGRGGAAGPERDAIAAAPAESRVAESVRGTFPQARTAPARAGLLAPPSVRVKALNLGIDLRQVAGTGPAGRITHDDLAGYVHGRRPVTGSSPERQADTRVEEIRVTGLRRRIADRMALAKARIPHFSYIEEVDMTALENLRARLNEERTGGQPKLTLLPFLMKSLVRAVAEKPQMNALFDDEAGIVRQYGGVHVGVAVQTGNGLVVPVVRHVETLSLRDCAREVERLSEATRQGKADRSELSGSTITITSLGAMGGIATTPVINRPEVAILGVNKMRITPVWDGAEFRPGKIMNLSSSFDHRVIDGWDAALFIQRIKVLLETPAMIFLEE